MRRLLDTTVLIDVVRGDNAAVEFVSRLEERPVCSEVTRIELIRGLRSAERRGAARLLRAIDWHPVDATVARRAGELGRDWRRSHPGIDTADLAIAATAELTDSVLATSNLMHFPMFEDLEAPY